MEIRQILNNKKEYLPLLLLGDEQEDMIDKYLERGDLFALFDNDLKSICVVTKETDEIYEIKNLATYEKYQKKGYGTALLEHIFQNYSDRCKYILLGTGDNAEILTFYNRRGFAYSHTISDFFIDNYDKPIFENGKQLVDMIYLRKTI